MPKHPEFFEGSEALQEVAKPEGLWNWCLLGPDPKTLPLAAGGYGFVDCMRDVIGQHPHTYGLLRMSFGKGSTVFHRWVKVDAADEDENQAKGMSAVTKGKAAAQKSEMQMAFKEYSSTQVTVTIRNKEGCTAAHVIKALIEGGTADKDRITVEENRAAVDEFMERFHDEEGTRQEKEEEEDHSLAVALEHDIVEDDKNAAHPKEETEEKPPADQPDESASICKIRSKIWVPKVDEPVMVYSTVTKIWYDDAFVTQFALESFKLKGVIVPAGAVKVIFNHNTSFKWVFPPNISSVVRKTNRPVVPRSVQGFLWKETHNFMTLWNQRYCVLKQGCLQWWFEKEDMGWYSPNGILSLFGLKMQIASGTIICLRTASTASVIYRFDTGKKKGLALWVEALSQHGRYCDEMKKYTGNTHKPIDSI